MTAPRSGCASIAAAPPPPLRRLRPSSRRPLTRVAAQPRRHAQHAREAGHRQAAREIGRRCLRGWCAPALAGPPRRRPARLRRSPRACGRCRRLPHRLARRLRGGEAHRGGGRRADREPRLRVRPHRQRRAPPRRALSRAYRGAGAAPGNRWRSAAWRARWSPTSSAATTPCATRRCTASTPSSRPRTCTWTSRFASQPRLPPPGCPPPMSAATSGSLRA